MSDIKACISRKSLRHNALLLKGVGREGTGLCAVVKANAYGLDAPMVTSCLADVADWFAVVSIEEAEEIAEVAGGKSILALRPMFAGMEAELVRLAQARGFHGTICSTTGLRYVESVLAAERGRLKVQVKIDTGMGRAGCRPEQVGAIVAAIDGSEAVELAGVFTHFATAEEDDLGFVDRQLEVFRKCLEDNGLDKRAGIVRHAASSAATLRAAGAHFDMIRPGISLYGYLFSRLHGKYDLRPVVRLEAPLLQVKAIRAGDSCGYGRLFVAERDMVVGLVPVGYADAIPREMSNRGCVLIDGREAPILGRISMDQTIIDLSKVVEPREGMTVTVIDDQVDSPGNVQAIADQVGSNCQAILTGIGRRVRRVLAE